MFRRQFMRRITLASGSAWAAVHAGSLGGRKTITFRIRGFTCVTCAVGLETMLRRQKGILRAEASYPKANVTIDFNPALVTEASLEAYIAEMGFGLEK